uniref:Peptidase S74 domain-containing protein n=1 Tax=Candidatus Kentrum sp. LFY TaxID=2126342 RepID=A0A450U5P8_9GAMM|nr:MAG: hypothetical protein BECKLFY1418B_GA0070995_100382 [Candidatus Kentron sp. LFY]
MKILHKIKKRLFQRMLPLSAHVGFVENVQTANPGEVLEKLAEVPVQTWNYKWDDASIRHMGPMAQDFYGAFGLGNTDKFIYHMDAIGVCLAAIKGLKGIVEDHEHRIARNEERIEENARLMAQLQGKQE